MDEEFRKWYEKNREKLIFKFVKSRLITKAWEQFVMDEFNKQDVS